MIPNKLKNNFAQVHDFILGDNKLILKNQENNLLDSYEYTKIRNKLLSEDNIILKFYEIL